MRTAPSPPRLQILGILLFLFIPAVLFLYVRHPAPVGLSLGAGVILMVGHRRLARPYMLRALPWKCVWCNRVLPEGEGEVLELRAGAETLPARCCAGHREPAARTFAFLHAWRWPLRLGIFVPLPAVTAFFQLVIGFTVNLAALGALFVRNARAPVEVSFPVHNFFLLGV